MSYIMDLDFDEAQVVSVTDTMSVFETQVFSDIMIDAYERNYKLSHVHGLEVVKFNSTRELIEHYWSSRLN